MFLRLLSLHPMGGMMGKRGLSVLFGLLALGLGRAALAGDSYDCAPNGAPAGGPSFSIKEGQTFTLRSGGHTVSLPVSDPSSVPAFIKHNVEEAEQQEGIASDALS